MYGKGESEGGTRPEDPKSPLMGPNISTSPLKDPKSPLRDPNVPPKGSQNPLKDPNPAAAAVGKMAAAMDKMAAPSGAVRKRGD